MYYPVWGWLLAADHPLPDAPPRGMRLDIHAALAKKRQAIAAHRSQHSPLIADDPTAFQLPAELLAIFERPYEVFLAA
jgi:hypothetical protein